MAIIKGWWSQLLRPQMARVYFNDYVYPTRHKGQKRHSYRNARRRAFQRWIKALRIREDVDSSWAQV